MQYIHIFMQEDTIHRSPVQAADEPYWWPVIIDDQCLEYWRPDVSKQTNMRHDTQLRRPTTNTR